MKKIISLALSVMMLLSMFGTLNVFANAEGIYTDSANEKVSAFLTHLADKEYDENYFFVADMAADIDYNDKPTVGVRFKSSDSNVELKAAIGQISAKNKGSNFWTSDSENIGEITITEGKYELVTSHTFSYYATNKYLGFALLNSEVLTGDTTITIEFCELVIDGETTSFGNTLKTIEHTFNGPITFADDSLVNIGKVLTSLKFGRDVSYEELSEAMKNISDDGKKELAAAMVATDKEPAKISAETVSKLAEIIKGGVSADNVKATAGNVSIPNIALAASGNTFEVVATEVEVTVEHDKDDAVAYDITIKVDGKAIPNPTFMQKVIVDLPNSWSSEGVVYKHADETEWKDVEVVDNKMIIYADSFSTFTFAGTKTAATEDVRAEKVKYDIIQDEVNKNKFSLVIKPLQKADSTGTMIDTQIIKFAAAAMKFDFYNSDIAEDEAMKSLTYTWEAAEGIKINPISSEMSNRTSSIACFSFIATAKDGENLLTGEIGKPIKIADIYITGTGKFKVATNTFTTEEVAYCETKEDNEVYSLTVKDEYKEFELKLPEYELEFFVDFGLNRIEKTEADYLGMTITLNGENTDTEKVLKIGEDIVVTLDNNNKTATATGKVTLPMDNYTFVVEGKGYRTYWDMIHLDRAKKVNLWNNALTSGKINVIADDNDTAKAITFLVGDIYMDGIVDVYDLSAVTSYYNKEVGEAGSETYNKYIPYDLNRDGKISLTDIAYVQVSYGN